MPTRWTFSVIIPVLHESKIINTLLDSLKQFQIDESVEIIVVDGSPSQDTLRVISNTNIRTCSSPQGRGRQMNEGAALATGEILVFLHADTFLPSNAFLLIKTTLENTRYIGGAFTLGIQTKNILLKIIASFSTLRSRLTRAPYGDQVQFFRKSFFDKLGGYRDIPLMEDVEMMRRVRKNHGEIVILSTPVITSDRRWTQEGFIYTTVRDLIIIFLYWCGFPAERLAKFYPWQKE